MAFRSHWTAASVAALALGALGACGGGGGGSSTTSTGGGPVGSPPPPPPVSQSILDTTEEAARFMRMASVGADKQQIDGMVGRDASQWVSAELNKSPTLILPQLNVLYPNDPRPKGRPHSDLYWDALISEDEQLRLRMSFALSQIMVISDTALGSRSKQTAHYMDILSRNAFGNYRTLLEDVTYSPAMAEYLTYMRNRKGDPRTGRMPDENYAREVLQLFSIGLVELNMDGTPKLGADGQPIETYDNDDIIGLARVFTGLGPNGSGDNWFGDTLADDAEYTRLKMWDRYHSELEKSFLGVTIPAGTTGDETIRIALDTIAEHPNVAPFLSRQLIQRFTASNPSPEYVERVARAFEAGRYTSTDGTQFGTGQRGDLGATIAAVLLDDSVHRSLAEQSVSDGKVREPVLKFLHFVRAFNASPVRILEREARLADTNDVNTRFGQHPYRSPSVFNFYRPGYVAPNTASGEANLTAPELQIVNEAATLGYLNSMTNYVITRSDDTGDRMSLVPDYADELALANDPAALVSHLDIYLTGGTMTEDTKAQMEGVIAAIPVSDSDIEDTNTDLLRRVHAAVLMATASGAYAVSQ